MLRRPAASLLTVVVALLSVLALTTPAGADGGGTDVGHCDNDFVCGGVTVPGETVSPNAGKGGGKGGGGGGGKKPVKDGKTCATGATTVGPWPCKLDGVGNFDDATKCYVQRTDPQPPKSDPIWAGHTDGAIYTVSCLAIQNNVPSRMEWRATDPAAVGPTAAELAQQAFARMRLDGAAIGSAPPTGSEGLVGMPVWLWTAETPQTWGPQAMTAAAGGLSVTVTAKVTSIAWSMGDGTTLTCTKPGAHYQASLGKADSPDCGHRYNKAGTHNVTATSNWAVDWVATNGETGTLPATTRTAATTVRIGELQVVN